MTKVKICGLMRMEDIETVNTFRPDYIGFVFADSRRQVDFKAAELLKSALHSDIQAVGVFVDAEIEEIAELVQKNVIDLIQLHGQEDAKYIDRLRAVAKVPIIKAVRVQSREQIQEYDHLPCDYLLLDAAKPGSGKSFDWSKIPNMQKPYFLAGGLDSQNVIQAIQLLHPYCVDVSSGVETDGIKDNGKIAEFINQVRSVR